MLDLAQRAELPLTVAGPATVSAPFAVALAAAAGIAGSWALASYARLRAVGVAPWRARCLWTTFTVAGGLGAGPAVASAMAAVVVGFCGEALTDRLRIPPLLVAVCGIVPLLPGLAIYGGLFGIVVAGDTAGGLEALVGALAIGLALAAGVTLGEHLGRPLAGQRDRFDRRVRRRAATHT